MKTQKDINYDASCGYIHEKMMHGDECHTCFGSPSNPYRRYDERGAVTEGCVDECHTGHLITISESDRWHCRPAAKAIRKARKQYLKQFKS